MSMEPVFLIVICLLCGIIIWLIARAKKPDLPIAAPAPAPEPAMSAAIDDDSGGIPAEHIAAIAAAIHCLSKNVAILRIEDARRASTWVAEGRAVLHASHDPKKR